MWCNDRSSSSHRCVSREMERQQRKAAGVGPAWLHVCGVQVLVNGDADRGRAPLVRNWEVCDGDCICWSLGRISSLPQVREGLVGTMQARSRDRAWAGSGHSWLNREVTAPECRHVGIAHAMVVPCRIRRPRPSSCAAAH